MKARLRSTVGEIYWKKAHDYLNHFLNEKRKKQLGSDRPCPRPSSDSNRTSVQAEVNGVGNSLNIRGSNSDQTNGGSVARFPSSHTSAGGEMRGKKRTAPTALGGRPSKRVSRQSSSSSSEKPAFKLGKTPDSSGPRHESSNGHPSPHSVALFPANAAPAMSLPASPRNLHPPFSSDAELAAHIQEREVRLARKRESEGMMSTTTGLAYKFVECFVEETKSFGTMDGICLVARDDMVFQTVAMLNCMETFKSTGKDTGIDVGYHFTSKNSMEHIQRDGLMTRSDQELNPKLNSRESAHIHGNAFGDGVYTGNNPFAFKKYGEVGIVVARLQGTTTRIRPDEVVLSGTLLRPKIHIMAPIGQEALKRDVNTIIGNKTMGLHPNLHKDEVVLLQSSQCIPLVRFPASLVDDRFGGIPSALLPWIEATKKAVDNFFNRDQASVAKSTQLASAKAFTAKSPPNPKTLAPGTAPAPQATVTQHPRQSPKTQATTRNRSLLANPPSEPASNLPVSKPTAIPVGRSGASITARLKCMHTSPFTTTTSPGRAHWQHSNVASASLDVITYHAPDTMAQTGFVERPDGNIAIANATCAICQNDLPVPLSDIRRVKKCGHLFCRDCILKALHYSRKCPCCHQSVGEPQGKSPSGEMKCSVTSQPCTGYNTVGSIKIDYTIFKGMQKSYHDNEGRPFDGIRRTAYLPDNDDGRRLLKRLQYAFRHGLTFSVGKSLSTGNEGVITWGTIHHKTRRGNGPYGWPDDDYIVRCNRELDNHGVPSWNNCP
ncbi:hypothetical protein ACHAWF_008506 [Thalassiosira exigua]